MGCKYTHENTRTVGQNKIESVNKNSDFKTSEAYLELEGSERKHQLSEVHLQLSERSRQLSPRKHKAFGNLVSSYMIHTWLLLYNRLHKHLPFLLNQFDENSINYYT